MKGKTRTQQLNTEKEEQEEGKTRRELHGTHADIRKKKDGKLKVIEKTTSEHNDFHSTSQTLLQTSFWSFQLSSSVWARMLHLPKIESANLEQQCKETQ